MPFGFGRGWFGRGWWYGGRCWRFPWLPRWWWTGMYGPWYPAPYYSYPGYYWW
ncbi:MAG: hypothetical protein ACXQT5_00945 [Candidatus Syntropharchaeia archaeon]